MPILKPEPAVFPEHLFDLPADRARWWVAYVRSRQEKNLARRLREAGVPFFLPLAEKRIRRNGRWFVSHLPLFPGYVFFRGSQRERHQALGTNLVVQVLEVADQDLLQRELRELRELQRAGLPLVPHPYLRPGDLVDIREGALRGYRGVVLRDKGRVRLVVSISLLRRSVAAEVDRQVLAPVDRPGFERRAAAS